MAVGRPSRPDVVESAVAGWTRQMVSLDGGNRMLYFRELSRGTLELSPSRPETRAGNVERLVAGRPVRLSELFAADARGESARRVRAISAKARANFEEKGLATLYVAHSFATWKRAHGRQPRAPVVMLPARVVLEGPGGDDAVLQVIGPAETNRPFAYAIHPELGHDPYPDADERPEDYRRWLEHVARECRDVPGFSIDRRLFLANLEFSKLPMVLDLEQHLDVLMDNDIVAAIAGDQTAQAGLATVGEVPRDISDTTAPDEEFLVCDADAAQNRAIAAALQGQSLVIHGPPGTGKSQTIANLVAALAAHGKTALFVAEKRAAIGAVTRRLDAAGCGELVLDMHDGASRSRVAKSLSSSVAAIDYHLANEPADAHPDLVKSRRQLIAHRRQMHTEREPYGLALFDLQAMLGTPEAETTGLRIAPELLTKWTEAGRARVRALLAEWRGLAERLDDDPTGMWCDAALATPEEVAEAEALVADMTDRLAPNVDERYRASLAELARSAETDLPLEEFAGFVQAVGRLSDRYDATFFDGAERVARALRAEERSALGRLIARIIDPAYRSSRRTLHELGVAERPPRELLYDARNALAADACWAGWFPDESAPRRVVTGTALAEAVAAYEEARQRLIALVPPFASVEGFRDQNRTLRSMQVHGHLAAARGELARVAADIEDYGLARLLRLSERDARRKLDLGQLAMRVFASSAIDAITWQEPELAMFDGARHSRSAERFADLDRRHLVSTAPRVMRNVAARAAAALDEHPREAALVRHEAETAAPRVPVRELIGRAPNVVKALRPCWAMSPLLVSRLLPATQNLFDVVVFDEASQILPMDAIASIARAGQVVVAGDRYQLPPSRFLVAESSHDEVEQGESADRDEVALESESILDVMRRLLPEYELHWHYRSHDERLINFSNMHIYDRSLVSFPATNQGTGVSLEVADALPKTAEQAASNPAVVDRVVELVLEHAAHSRGESLGVIGMGLRHVNDISEALRVALGDSDEAFDGFFEEKGDEPFFVKTMDRAQGDERDHIILSIGYGRKADGDVVYRWGSLNRRGGARRLNVAVTRAKRRMTVVSSLVASDIDPTRTRARGATLLTSFLEYAERGGSLIPGREHVGPMTPFELSVRDRLQQSGIPLQPHYGIGPLRVDFAAFEARGRPRPVLAIETDGLAYNASPTARDRDRLRPEMLRQRGWRFHRIWSIDWYRDPEAETARVAASWERAVREATDLEQFERAARTGRPVVAGRGRSPIAVRRAGILDYQRAELVELIRWIQSDEVSRTEDEMLAAARETLGLPDSSGRVDRTLRAAIEEARGF